VDDDGRVRGHVALWGECHLGSSPLGQQPCVTAPSSVSNYAYFHTGETCAVDDGGVEHRIPAGVLTMDTGHPGLHASPQTVMAHYEDTGSVVADVVCGEDEWGIWTAGALRPGVTGDEVRAIRAASPSGDWRRIHGSLEMVGVLMVNVPGFPVPRPQALVAAGVQVELVAPVSPEPPEDATQREVDALRRDLTRVLAMMDGLTELYVEQLAAKVCGADVRVESTVEVETENLEA
jgi:hypothetical protein